MKFTMFTRIDGMKCAINRDGMKCAINRDCVKYVEEFKDGFGNMRVKINLAEDEDIVVREDFATVQSRLNIIEG